MLIKVSRQTRASLYLTMRQQTLAMAADEGVGFEQYRKRTRREEFLKTQRPLSLGQPCVK